DDRRRLPGSHLAAGSRADDDRERLRHHEVLVGHAGWRRPAAARGHSHQLGEAAVHVDADRGPGQAEIAIALAAERTDAARVIRLDRDAITHARRRHPGADGFDTANEFVTHHARVGNPALAGKDAVVRATEACDRHTNERLAR